jgi:hypothetical protein
MKSKTTSTGHFVRKTVEKNIEKTGHNRYWVRVGFAGVLVAAPATSLKQARKYRTLMRNGDFSMIS